MKYFWLVLLVAAAHAHAEDPIDDLINEQQEARDTWSEPEESLPADLLFGNAAGIQVYSTFDLDDQPNLICADVDVIQLAELSQVDASLSEFVLNTDRPQIKEMLSRSCLIRPKDTLMAVGSGWQKPVEVKDFFLRRESVPCEKNSAYGLWISLTETLPEEPMFYSSNEDLVEGSVPYVPLVEQKKEQPSADFRRVVAPALKNPEDYFFTPVLPALTDGTTVYVARRRTIDLEDNSLPNEAVVLDDGNGARMVWLERVDTKNGSGHVRVEAAFDSENDDIPDLLIAGDHHGCPYRLVLKRTLNGAKIDAKSHLVLK